MEREWKTTGRVTHGIDLIPRLGNGTNIVIKRKQGQSYRSLGNGAVNGASIPPVKQSPHTRLDRKTSRKLKIHSCFQTALFLFYPQL